MIFSSFISKSNINDNFILSRAFLENKNFDFNYKTNFRNSSDEIVNKIYSIYNKYLIFKFQFNIIQKLSKYLIFSNTYLAKKAIYIFKTSKIKLKFILQIKI